METDIIKNAKAYKFVEISECIDILSVQYMMEGGLFFEVKW